jgi:DNA-binding transcriptional MerR regulator
MMTVHEVSELAHVSVRTLHHYDQIGLLRPSCRTEAGYRLYGEGDLARLQQVLLFRELGFPLREIGAIIDSPHYEQSRVLKQQIELLRLKREHIDNLIDLAEGMRGMETKSLEFGAFDTSKIDEYAAQAKASWGTTPEWKDYQRRSAGRTKEEELAMGEDLMALFKPFGQMAAEGADPASPEAMSQARAIQAFITDHFYACSDEVFLGLGRMYGAGGDFTEGIDAAAGEGAAVFAMRAIEACFGV